MQLDENDGWIRDGETLLLWVPLAYRAAFRLCARVLIDKGRSTVFPYIIDLEALFKYSGRDWTKVYSELADVVAV